MPDVQRSPYFKERPLFVPAPTVNRRSKFAGTRLLIVFAVLVVLAVAAAGLWFFNSGFSTVVSGTTPFDQTANPLLNP